MGKELKPKQTELKEQTRNLSLVRTLAIVGQILALLFVFLLSFFPVESDDLFINIKTGELIWQNKALPETDPFSYTANHIRWVNHEWITTLIFYLLYRSGGFNLIIIFKTALIVLSFGIIMYRARFWSRSSWLLPLILAVCAYTASDRYIDRAHLMNFLFFAVYLVTLLRWKEGSRLAGYSLPVITLIWVNFHSGAILAPVMCAIVIIGDFLQRYLGNRFSYLKRENLLSQAQLKIGLLLLVLHLPALLINPFWYETVLYPIQQAGWDIYRHYIYEWMPVYGPFYRQHPIYTAYLILNAILIAALLINHKKIQLADVGLAVLGIVLGHSAVRFLDILALVSFAIITRQLMCFSWAEGKSAQKLKLHAASVLLILAADIFVLKHGYTIVMSHRKVGLGVSQQIYPTIPIEYLDRLGIEGNMFNQYDLGSFIIWKCYPKRKVFIDGRNQLYPLDFYKEYLSVNSSSAELHAVMDKYNINYVFVLNQAKPPPHEPGIYDFLSQSDQWKLIYWDDLFLVYLRNSPENQEIIRKYEYKYYDPVLPPRDTIAKYLLTEPDACIAELNRVLALNPNCQRARIVLDNARKAIELSKNQKITIE